MALVQDLVISILFLSVRLLACSQRLLCVYTMISPKINAHNVCEPGQVVC